MPDLSDEFLDELMRELETNLGIAVPTYAWMCDNDTCDGQPHGDYNYPHARAKQRKPKGHWKTWLLLCGRGFGKTRTGSETFLDLVLARPVDTQGRPTWHLIGCRTHAETVNLMIKGPSSLTQAMDRRGIKYKLNGSNFNIELETGQIIINQHAEGNPEFGRGGEWATVWIDEIGTFKRIKDAFTQALPFAMRVKLPDGERSRMLLTTTPKAEYVEPFEIMKDLVAKDGNGTVVVTQGTTWENAANIPPEDLAEWELEFPEGTRTRLQELDAELLDNVENALWTAELIETTKRTSIEGNVVRRAVGLDPSGTAKASSDACGIVLVAKTIVETAERQDELGRPLPKMKLGHYWLEKDLSAVMPVSQWAKAAVQLAVAHSCPIVYETNFGADMVPNALQSAARDLGVACPTLIPSRATDSKGVRAGWLAGLYSQGRAHHVGHLPTAVHEKTTWQPEDTNGKSPNSIDAEGHVVKWLDKPTAVAVPVSDAY